MEKELKVFVADDDHVWINGNQFISLRRFIEARNEVSSELTLLRNKVKELTEALDAVKTLVKFDENANEKYAKMVIYERAGCKEIRYFKDKTELNNWFERLNLLQPDIKIIDICDVNVWK